MPASKNKRKNGKTARGGYQQRCRARRVAQFKNRTDAQIESYLEKEVDRLQAQNTRVAKLYALACVKADPGAVKEQFIKAQFALKRLEGTQLTEDFNLVASTIMLGFLTLNAARDETPEEMKAMREASFSLVKMVRARNHMTALDPEDLKTAHAGLDAAQYALEWALENNLQALAEAFRFNTPDFRAQNPEIYREAERALLGEYAETVFRWEKEDLV